VNDFWQDFQGTWYAVLLAEDGRKGDPEEVKRTRLTVSGNRYTLREGDYEFHGVLTGIDPARNRGPVDFLADGGHHGVENRFLGIYVLEDDELSVCVAGPGRDRPAEFNSRAGSGRRLYLFKRYVPSRVGAREGAFCP
jgi:uncharacterized protein (TIGR03067 family)